MRHRNGAIPVEVSFSDMLLDGQRHYVAFIRDITERKRSEKALLENEREFRVAREIQQHLFPSSRPRCRDLRSPGLRIRPPRPAAITSITCPCSTVGSAWWSAMFPDMASARPCSWPITRAYLRLLTSRRESPGEILTVANKTLIDRHGIRTISHALPGAN